MVASKPKFAADSQALPRQLSWKTAAKLALSFGLLALLLYQVDVRKSVQILGTSDRLLLVAMFMLAIGLRALEHIPIAWNRFM